MNLQNIIPGDKFSNITYSEYGNGIVSAYDYVVVRTGKRDVVAHAIGRNGEVFTNMGDGTPREFRFRRTDEVCEIGAVEISKARDTIAKKNRIAKVRNFLDAYRASDFDEEFVLATEAFMKRRGI